MSELTIIAMAKLVGVSANLLLAICQVETGCTMKTVYDVHSISYGAFQIKYKTAKMFNKDLQPHHLEIPEENALHAAMYLKYQLERYSGDVDCAIAAYNAGSCRKDESGRIKNKEYVSKVKRNWKRTYAIRYWGTA